jgi:hypothetical protein
MKKIFLLSCLTSFLLFGNKATAQNGVIVCEEKWLPNYLDFTFVMDTTKCSCRNIEKDSFGCLSKGDNEMFDIGYKLLIATRENKNIIDVVMRNKYGKISIHDYIDEYKKGAMHLTFGNNSFDTRFFVKDFMLNGPVYGFYNKAGSDEARILTGIDSIGFISGFKNNARVGFFAYNYDNNQPFANGRYSGKYLKIDTSSDGKYLVYYDNLGKEIKREKKSKQSVLRLKKKYDIYKFDFTFPLLIEYRDGWWKFYNIDGSLDRKILYQDGTEEKTIRQ